GGAISRFTASATATPSAASSSRLFSNGSWVPNPLPSTKIAVVAIATPSVRSRGMRAPSRPTKTARAKVHRFTPRKVPTRYATPTPSALATQICTPLRTDRYTVTWTVSSAIHGARKGSSECSTHTEIHQARVAASTLLRTCTRSVSRSRERHRSARRLVNTGPPGSAADGAPWWTLCAVVAPPASRTGRSGCAARGVLALVRSARLLAQVLDHRGDPFGGSWGDVAGEGADQLLGDGPDLQVRVLGDPAEQREGFVGGEAEVVHEDPLGLLDGRLPGELLAPLVELAAQPLRLGQLGGQCRLGGVEQGERRGAVVGLQHGEGRVRGSDQPQVEPIGLAGGDQDRQGGHGQVVHLAQVQDDGTLLARPLLHPGLD